MRLSRNRPPDPGDNNEWSLKKSDSFIIPKSTFLRKMMISLVPIVFSLILFKFWPRIRSHFANGFNKTAAKDLFPITNKYNLDVILSTMISSPQNIFHSFLGCCLVAWNKLSIMQFSKGTRNTPKVFLLLISALTSMPVICGSSLGTRNVDLIESLQLWNTTYTGLTVIPGPRAIAPAIFLQGDNRDVRLPAAYEAAAEAMLSSTKEFTLMATIQQEEKNSGTILSFSKGSQRYLELQSSGRKDEVRLHYINNGLVHIETFPFRLADQKWHKVSLIVSGSQLELWVDCNRIFRRLAPPPVTNFTLLSTMDPPLDPSDLSSMSNIPNSSIRGHSMALFLGQRNPGHFLFKGALQDVRIVEGATGHLLQCPEAEAQCPTCGGFQHLTEQVAVLQDLVLHLTQKITSTENRLANIEECDCQKSCRVNGTIRQDGASWKSGCEICSCRHGEVTCRPVPCPNLTCKNPVYTEGECCPLCLKQCSLKGVVYDHGQSVSPRQCVDCECRDGKMECRRIDPETTCPELKCSLEEQFSVPGQCCKFCPGVDYCSENKGSCHENATCINLQTTFTCHCNKGYSGDGKACTDIDECKVIGAHHGHYCQSNTKCINRVGSYECQCKEGYVRHDEFTCKEHDECTAGAHDCPENSECINVEGSYICNCSAGYKKIGDMCTPICNGTCLNGGMCVSPNQCICRLGFYGKNCELDVDECALDLHRCPQNSQCVNLPGWYSCQCNPGFSSLSPLESTMQICKDINECELNTHTCSSTAKCVNIEGSFKCVCNEKTSNCTLSCSVDHKEYQDGESWNSEGSKCLKCLCMNGTIVCDQPICNCSSSNVDLTCCPECSQYNRCNLNRKGSNESYASGETWIDQCQTCECLFGEIDCWPQKCPPVNCLIPIRLPGDCCPRCSDDPCSNLVSNFNDTTNHDVDNIKPCHHYMLQSSSSSEWFSPRILGFSGHKCQMPYCSDLMSRKGAGTVLRVNPFFVLLSTIVVIFLSQSNYNFYGCQVFVYGVSLLGSIIQRFRSFNFLEKFSKDKQCDSENDDYYENNYVLEFTQMTKSNSNNETIRQSERNLPVSNLSCNQKQVMTYFSVKYLLYCKNIKYLLQKSSSVWKRKLYCLKTQRLKLSFNLRIWKPPDTVAYN